MRTRLPAVAASLAAVALILAPAAPAVAHDQLVSSSPSPDERLETAPSEVRLEFAADVMDVGALVMVVDGDGTDWVAAEVPTIDGPLATIQLLPDLPDAGYQVRWRVVSSDGHPISGFIPFTVGDGTPLALEVAPGAAVDQVTTTQAHQEQEAVWRLVLIGAGGAGAALALLALVSALRRPRERAVPGDDATPPGSIANDQSTRTPNT
jgi:methionine-rich copper-binding protein CopC